MLPAPLTVRFEPPGGGFATPLQVSLRADDPTAQVHYTLDGSLPSSSSATVTAPIAVGRTTLVRAVAVRGSSTGPVANAGYFQLAADARGVRSDLPLMLVHMRGDAAPSFLSQDKVEALLGVFEPEAGSAQLQRPAQLTSRIGIKVRGRSTRLQEKHSYTLELWGAAQEDAPAPLLGLPQDGDWVLYAPYVFDRSLLHNALGYAISRSIGRYAPRTQFCELYLVSDAEQVSSMSYAGVYLLTERITRGAERVPVQKLQAPDVSEPALTGGYIVQVNEPDAPEEAFMAAGLRFNYVYPKSEDIQPAQKTYIAGYLDSVQRAVSAADGRDPTSGRHYEELIDVASFIDHHILNMLIKNPDAFALSSYFHKARDGKLAAGPLWDLDLAMGADDPFGQRSLDPTHWGPGADAEMFRRSFWRALFDHAAFERAYWARWRELLAGPLRISELRALIAGFERQLAAAEGRNRARWPASAPRDNSFAAEVRALSDWLDQRVVWIQANLDRLP